METLTPEQRQVLETYHGLPGLDAAVIVKRSAAAMEFGIEHGTSGSENERSLMDEEGSMHDHLRRSPHAPAAPTTPSAASGAALAAPAPPPATPTTPSAPLQHYSAARGLPSSRKRAARDQLSAASADQMRRIADSFEEMARARSAQLVVARETQQMTLAFYDAVLRRMGAAGPARDHEE
jgi:hypothetical protein